MREHLRVRSAASGGSLLTGAAAGLLAGAVVGQVDRLLDRFISPAQRRREKRVRVTTPHRLAGPLFAERISGRALSKSGEQWAQAVFNVAYGVGWGLVYAAVRRRFPQLARAGGLPFAVPFFLVCDGVIAPLLRLTPHPGKIPWQPNAKELANHIAWTAAAEVVNRAADRAFNGSAARRVRGDSETGSFAEREARAGRP